MSLRVPATCAAIRALVEAGRVKPETAADMIAAYAHLRMVEHRLQMIDDQQTQTLPREGPELDHVARFCGFASTAEFTETLLSHLGKVERSEEHTSELQSLMRISYAVFCLNKKNRHKQQHV